MNFLRNLKLKPIYIVLIVVVVLVFGGLIAVYASSQNGAPEATQPPAEMVTLKPTPELIETPEAAPAPTSAPTEAPAPTQTPVFETKTEQDLMAVADMAFIEQRVNILFMNVLSDTPMEQGENPLCADGFTVLSLDAAKGTAAWIAIPGDTYFKTDKGTDEMLYEVFEQQGGAWQGGPDAVSEAVSGLLYGMPIHRYIALNDQSFTECADAVALEITPQEQGNGRLEGAELLDYTYGLEAGRGDGRATLQNDAFRQMLDAFHITKRFYNAPELLDMIRAHVVTDMTDGEVAAMALGLSRAPAHQMQFSVAPGSGVSVQDLDYYILNENQTHAAIAALYPDAAKQRAQRSESAVKKEIQKQRAQKAKDYQAAYKAFDTARAFYESVPDGFSLDDLMAFSGMMYPLESALVSHVQSVMNEQSGLVTEWLEENRQMLEERHSAVAAARKEIERYDAGVEKYAQVITAEEKSVLAGGLADLQAVLDNGDTQSIVQATLALRDKLDAVLGECARRVHYQEDLAYIKTEANREIASAQSVLRNVPSGLHAARCSAVRSAIQSLKQALSGEDGALIDARTKALASARQALENALKYPTAAPGTPTPGVTATPGETPATTATPDASETPEVLGASDSGNALDTPTPGVTATPTATP